MGEEVLVLNGDTIFDLNYLDLAVARREEATPAAIALRAVEDASRYGAAALRDGRVTTFAEKEGSGPGLVSGGVYVIETRLLQALPAGRLSLEHDVLAPLAEDGLLAGREYAGFFLDIGVPDALAAATARHRDWRHKPAVFFDRDGVLNEDRGHVHRDD